VRGVLVFLCLLAFPAAASAATEQVQDGSFEAGSTAWAFESGAERCVAISPSCGAFPAATGSFYGASKTLTFVPANTGAYPVGTITQLVSLPELPGTLSFKIREIRDVGALGKLEVLLKVKYAGETISEITSATDTFGTVVVPIPATLAGAIARPLTFEFTCFNNTTMSEACARFDIDDVSLVSGTGPVTTGGGASQPGASSDTTAPSDTPALSDTTAPETALGQMKRSVQVKSSKVRAKVRARFTSEAGARFECKLDGRAYAPCISPKTLKLKVGRHIFRVKAVDTAGNVDQTPAKAVVRVKLKPA
jgi:hypothetical protein